VELGEGLAEAEGWGRTERVTVRGKETQRQERRCQCLASSREDSVNAY
jgi:hypothetical protein